jgi:hypothetical protein
VTNLIKLDEAEQQIPAPGEVSTLIFCPWQIPGQPDQFCL